MNFEEKNCALHSFKGKAQYIEVFSYNYEYKGGMDEQGHISYQGEAYDTSFEKEMQE